MNANSIKPNREKYSRVVRLHMFENTYLKMDLSDPFGTILSGFIIHYPVNSFIRKQYRMQCVKQRDNFILIIGIIIIIIYHNFQLSSLDSNLLQQ